MFFANNWFGKTIIKENKNKVKPLINVILNKFLKKIVMLNIILFTKTRKVIAKKSDTINQDNHYLAINNTINISKLVQLLVKNGIFKKQLG